MKLLVAIAVVTLVTAVPNRNGDGIRRGSTYYNNEGRGEEGEEFTGAGGDTDDWGQGAGGEGYGDMGDDDGKDTAAGAGVEEVIGNGNNAGETWMLGPPLYLFCKIKGDDGSMQENKTCEMDAACSASVTLMVQGNVCDISYCTPPSMSETMDGYLELPPTVPLAAATIFYKACRVVVRRESGTTVYYQDCNCTCRDDLEVKSVYGRTAINAYFCDEDTGDQWLPVLNNNQCFMVGLERKEMKGGAAGGGEGGRDQSPGGEIGGGEGGGMGQGGVGGGEAGGGNADGEGGEGRLVFCKIMQDDAVLHAIDCPNADDLCNRTIEVDVFIDNVGSKVYYCSPMDGSDPLEDAKGGMNPALQLPESASSQANTLFQRACSVSSTDFSEEGSTMAYNKPCCGHKCGNGEVRATFGTFVIKAKYCEIGDDYLTNFNEKSCGAGEGGEGGGGATFPSMKVCLIEYIKTGEQLGNAMCPDPSEQCEESINMRLTDAMAKVSLCSGYKDSGMEKPVPPEGLEKLADMPWEAIYLTTKGCKVIVTDFAAKDDIITEHESPCGCPSGMCGERSVIYIYGSIELQGLFCEADDYKDWIEVFDGPICEGMGPPSPPPLQFCKIEGSDNDYAIECPGGGSCNDSIQVIIEENMVDVYYCGLEDDSIPKPVKPPAPKEGEKVAVFPETIPVEVVMLTRRACKLEVSNYQDMTYQMIEHDCCSGTCSMGLVTQLFNEEAILIEALFCSQDNMTDGGWLEVFNDDCKEKPRPKFCRFDYDGVSDENDACSSEECVLGFDVIYDDVPGVLSFCLPPKEDMENKNMTDEMQIEWMKWSMIENACSINGEQKRECCEDSCTDGPVMVTVDYIPLRLFYCAGMENDMLAMVNRKACGSEGEGSGQGSQGGGQNVSGSDPGDGGGTISEGGDIGSGNQTGGDQGHGDQGSGNQGSDYQGSDYQGSDYQGSDYQGSGNQGSGNQIGELQVGLGGTTNIKYCKFSVEGTTEDPVVASCPDGSQCSSSPLEIPLYGTTGMLNYCTGYIPRGQNAIQIVTQNVMVKACRVITNDCDYRDYTCCGNEDEIPCSNGPFEVTMNGVNHIVWFCSHRNLDTFFDQFNNPQCTPVCGGTPP